MYRLSQFLLIISIFLCINNCKKENQEPTNQSILGIPEVFTPNGDGINETWNIPSIHNFPDAVIQIYDMHKRLIIQYTGSDPDWDGRDSNGNPMTEGRYSYVIDLHNGSSIIRGYVYLDL